MKKDEMLMKLNFSNFSLAFIVYFGLLSGELFASLFHNDPNQIKVLENLLC